MLLARGPTYGRTPTQTLPPPVKSKGYHTLPAPPEAPLDVTAPPATLSDRDVNELPYSSDSSHARSMTYTVTVLDTSSSFLHSCKVPDAHQLPILTLPAPPTLGDGLSYLNDPLPIEVWLSLPTSDTPAIVGCGDTGGQCLIRHDVLLSQTLPLPRTHIPPRPTGLVVSEVVHFNQSVSLWSPSTFLTELRCWETPPAVAS